MSLEKQRGARNTIKRFIVDDNEIIDQTHILEYLKEFYEFFFLKMQTKNCSRNIPKISEDKSKLCEEDLTEKDLYDSQKSMRNNKSPGNNDLTKEFYETFWNELKEIFVDSLLEAKEKGHLSISQRQTIIKLIEKKDRNERPIKDWRPISL